MLVCFLLVCLVEIADIDPELDLLLDNSEWELDRVGISSIRSGPGELDLSLVLGILVGYGGIGVGLVAVDVLANGFINLELTNQGSGEVILSCVDQEALERGTTILGFQLKIIRHTFLAIIF